MLSRFIRKFSSVGGEEFIQKVDRVNSFLVNYKSVAGFCVAVVAAGFTAVGYVMVKEFQMVDKNFEMADLKIEKKFEMVDLKIEKVDLKMESINKKLDTLIIDMKHSSQETNNRVLKLEIDKGVKDELKKLRNKGDVEIRELDD